MKRDNEFTKTSKIEAFRMPRCLADEARSAARAQDLTFSQLMRRAIRRELGAVIETEEKGAARCV